jgi:tripeptide aminopeptidase
MGVEDASVDEHGYVMATIPPNLPKGHGKVPVMGLIAHVDTSPDVSGKDVEPMVHSPYDGKDITLSEGTVITVEENPHLKDNIGGTIITSDGRTLLGADDKAGVAEIMAAARVLLEDRSILHGRIRIAFTPDEEVGNGTKFFDVKRFGADFAFTIDGGEMGEVEDETFNAMSATFKVKGMNYHPGYAKGRMVNAARIASEIASMVPGEVTPENTAGREGYLHPHHIQGSVEEAMVKVLIRDFTMEGIGAKVELLEDIAELMRAKYPKADIQLDIQESYRNMRYVLEKDPRATEVAISAVEKVGIPLKKAIVRGGTDGSRLSYMGLPTPNIFAGGMNFHSRKEYVPLRSMEAAVSTMIELAKECVARSR